MTIDLDRQAFAQERARALGVAGGGRMIDWQKLADTINRNFGEPYLDHGHVRAWMTDSGFHLRVGRRDIALDENGEVWGSGTIVDEDALNEVEAGR